jgi:hypothetical protein
MHVHGVHGHGVHGHGVSGGKRVHYGGAMEDEECFDEEEIQGGQMIHRDRLLSNLKKR